MANDKDFKVKNGIQPTVYHESLGTVTSGTVGYALNFATLDENRLDYSGQDSFPQQGRFGDSGSKFYIAANGSETIYQYDLTTAWDASSGSYSTKSLDHSSRTGTTASFLSFKSDGTKVYIGDPTNDRIYQFALDPAWDISSATYENQSPSMSTNTPLMRGGQFKPDGTALFVNCQNNDRISKYTLSTPWAINTLSHDSNFSLGAGTWRDVQFKSDGKLAYFLDDDSGAETIKEYSLSTAWDISTLSATGKIYYYETDIGDNVPFLQIKDDGTKLYLGNNTDTRLEQYSITQASATLDLSTGNVFNVAPTANTQIFLSNPPESGVLGTATAFVSSEADTNIDSIFNITKYVGTGAARSITTNLDMATDGGLVWLKDLDNVEQHNFQDTEGTGVTEALLLPDTSAAQARVSPAAVTSFDTDGFSLGTSSDVNANTDNFVAFSFKKTAGFFDIQTWTGNATAGRTISHNLNDEIGFMVVKSTSDASNWVVYHRGLNGGTNPEQYSISLESSIGEYAATTIWNDTAPTTTEFTVGTSSGVNFNSRDYVAYIFAHNEDADSPIKCGYYTGNGSASGPSVNLGWEPQWLMIKKATDLGTDRTWWIFDKVRGLPAGSGDQALFSTDAAESGPWDFVDTTSTGFTLTTTDDNLNTNSYNYIYVAIRNPFHPTLSYDDDIQFEAGTAPTAAGNYETDVITFVTRDGGTTYTGFQAIDGAK